MLDQRLARRRKPFDELRRRRWNAAGELRTISIGQPEAACHGSLEVVMVEDSIGQT
jgi:hypothetical protein